MQASQCPTLLRLVWVLGHLSGSSDTRRESRLWQPRLRSLRREPLQLASQSMLLAAKQESRLLLRLCKDGGAPAGLVRVALSRTSAAHRL